MMTLLFPLLLITMMLPYTQAYWTKTIISLMMVTFMSFVYLYQSSISFSLLNSFLFTDQLSSSLITLTIWITTLMTMASVKLYNGGNKTKFFNFNTTLLCGILIMSFSVSNFINFYIMFESSLIPTLILILSWGYQPERLQAGMYLMLYTITASLPLLLTLTIFIKSNGTTSMVLPQMSNQIFYPPTQTIWWILSILAFLVKMPMYMFHLWLPKAHVEAPIAGSMMLAGVLLKLGGYGLLRMTPLYPKLMFSVSPLMNSIALWGGVITSLICLRQSDIKSLIAYSSIGHMAFVIMGITLLTPWGWQGSLVMMIAHGLCSSCLFALANLTYENTHTRSIFLTKGLMCLFPAISFWWFLLLVSNMAAPPSLNLFSEITLFMSAIWASPFYMMPLGICSFLAAAYSLFLFTSVNHGAPTLIFNPMSMLSMNSYTLCLLHAFPIFSLIAKPEIVSAWN